MLIVCMRHNGHASCGHLCEQCQCLGTLIVPDQATLCTSVDLLLYLGHMNQVWGPKDHLTQSREGDRKHTNTDFEAVSDSWLSCNNVTFV